MAMAVEMIQSLLRTDIENDIRDPIISFQLAEYGTIGLLAPHPTFWLQMAVILALLSILNTITAVAIYYCIVKNRGSTTSYLIGYGVIFPTLLVVPLRMSLYFGLHNTAMLIGVSASLSIVIFRCMMAMHGTLPPFVERDLPSFVLFYIAPLQFRFDVKAGKAVSSSRSGLAKNATTTLISLVWLCIILGLMVHLNFELFPRRKVKTFFDLVYWRNVLNNYAMAYLMGRCLEAGTLMVGVLIEFASGKSVIQCSNNPLTQSTSPSDFWGRRWNELVHIVLKGGVYIPLRKNGFSKGMAGLGTFAASGIFHEYILVALMLLKGVDYTPKYGYHLAFFAWNGVVLALENFLAEHSLIQWMKKNLPTPVITMLVIMTVLPIGHWFIDEYVEVGFFHDFAVGFPQVVFLHPNEH